MHVAVYYSRCVGTEKTMTRDFEIIVLNAVWFSYDYCHLVLTVSAQQNDSSSCRHCQHQQSPSINHFSKDNLRQLLVDMLQVRYSFIYKINFLMFFFSKEWWRICNRFTQCLYWKTNYFTSYLLIDSTLLLFVV